MFNLFGVLRFDLVKGKKYKLYNFWGKFFLIYLVIDKLLNFW